MTNMKTKPACLKSRMLENLIWIRELYIAGGKNTTDIDRDIERLREQVRLIEEAKENHNATS